MTTRGVSLKLTVFLLLSSDVHIAFADGYATYNPNTGRIVVEAYDVDGWAIRSKSGGLTGPDDPIANGVLVFSPDVSVSFDRYAVAEHFWIPEADRYVFHDLGRIGQTHLPARDLIFTCDCPFNGPISGFVIFIPEPTCGTILLGSVFVSLVLRAPLKSVSRGRASGPLCCTSHVR